MKHLYEKFFAYQLEKPSGLFGRFYMKRFLNEGNLRSNQLALKHLFVGKIESVLEIGFGGGWLIGELLKTTGNETRVVGLDHAPAMVKAAQRQFKNYSGRAEFHCGRAEKLPFPSESFSHVCSVHTVYFWEDADRVMSELYRVMRPGGVLLLGLHSKAKLETQSVTQYNFKFYEPQSVVDRLAAHGFTDITLNSYDPDEWEDNHCIVAIKPAKAERA